ncbi:MAG TPA: serine/threonine-protein kinase [Luteimonas sp.]|jgi:hypothetical protein|nr:serine/threonine-protein kinase [Luteimonas sp.]
MHPHEPGKPARDPSDSVLLTLARAAMASGTAAGAVSWPRLDLDDPAQRIFGDYELVEEISRGGMGVVYRARQRSLDRDVAVKFVAAGIDDEAGVARFLAEARAAARLVHPNIVPVHEVGSVDGLYYFSMPLIRGRTLADTLAAGKLPPEATVALLLSMCDAIDYAHRLGLLHLDLKPANVMLDERDQPQVADFGLARHMDERGGVDAQEVSGTPSFMAPEQILIRQYRLTPATDIYALGAILYRCLAGVSPHGEGQPDDVIRRAAAGRIRPPRSLDPSVPRDLDAICMKCLELQPADRYPNVAALADDLRRVRDGQPVSVRRIGAFERAQRWRRREPRLAAATAIAVVALLAGIAATTWQWREASAQRDIAMTQRDVAERERREADAQRDRAEGTSALGAWLYAQRADADGEASRGDLATPMLEWLRAHFPGNEARQEATLTSFFTALAREDRTAIEGLAMPFIEVMNRSYRQATIAALEAGNDPGRHALAARLAWFDERHSDNPARFTRLLDRAIAAQPDDFGVWNIAATFCTGPEGAVRCRHPEAVREMQRIDGGNAYPWLLLVRPGDREGNIAALREAAGRTRFEDHFLDTYRGYVQAFSNSGAEMPKLISGPLRVIAPKQNPVLFVALYESSSFPLAPYHSLTVVCDPRNAALPRSAYRDCRTVGETMARSRSSLLSRMIGSVIVRRLAKGTPLEREMVELRRHYLYVRAATDSLSEAQQRNYPLDRFLHDVSTLGELEAWENGLAYYGIPTQAPAGWQPADPRDLLLSEEREAHAAPRPAS